mgnify:CR=1 FL=1
MRYGGLLVPNPETVAGVYSIAPVEAGAGAGHCRDWELDVPSDSGQLLTEGRLVSVETTSTARLLVWDAGLLRKVLQEDLDLNVKMVQVLAANIASKLEASQDQATAALAGIWYASLATPKLLRWRHWLPC